MNAKEEQITWKDSARHGCFLLADTKIEIHTDRGTQRDRDTKGHRYTEADRQRHRYINTDTHRERDTERHSDRETEIRRDTDTKTQKQTDRKKMLCSFQELKTDRVAVDIREGKQRTVERRGKGNAWGSCQVHANSRIAAPREKKEEEGKRTVNREHLNICIYVQVNNSEL